MSTIPPGAPENTPLWFLNKTFKWYARHAWYRKLCYHASEILVLIIAAAIPASIAFTSDQRVPATLGTLVVVLTGLRSIYHFHDDWLRDTEACAQLETARQLYVQRVSPYDGPNRDALLIQRVGDIQMAETSSWVDLRKSAAAEAGAPKE